MTEVSGAVLKILATNGGSTTMAVLAQKLAEEFKPKLPSTGTEELLEMSAKELMLILPLLLEQGKITTDGQFSETTTPVTITDKGKADLGEQEMLILPVQEFCELVGQKKIEWIVQDFLAKSTRVVNAGKAGGYKSWLAMEMARAVASGTPFLGMPTTKTNVLLLDAENSDFIIKERLEKFGRPPGVYILCTDKFRFEKHTEDLVGKCRGLGIGLVIVDTLRRCHDADEDKAQEMSDLMNLEMQKLTRAGIAVFILYHKRKDVQGSDPLDMVRGTGEIVNIPEIVFLTERQRVPNNRVILHQIKNRVGRQLDPISVEINITDSKATFTQAAFIAETQADICGKELLKWIRLQGRDRFKFSEFKEWGAGAAFGRTTVQDAIRLLRELQLLDKVDHGIYAPIKDQTKVQSFLDGGYLGLGKTADNGNTATASAAFQ
jgi:hypothetical protein